MPLLEPTRKKRTFKEYTKSNQLYQEYEYILCNGMRTKHGKCIQYHKKNPSKIKSIGFYKNGVKHGSFKSFFINGQPCVEANFYEGRWDGEYKQWYRNGTLKMVGQLEKRGKKSTWVGVNQMWDKDGKQRGYWDGSKRLGDNKEEALEKQFRDKW